jgi:hypothetical protein
MNFIIYWIILALLGFVGAILAALITIPKEYYIFVTNIVIVSILLGVVIGKIYSDINSYQKKTKK